MNNLFIVDRIKAIFKQKCAKISVVTGILKPSYANPGDLLSMNKKGYIISSVSLFNFYVGIFRNLLMKLKFGPFKSIILWGYMVNSRAVL